VIATRRPARVRFALGALATVAGLGAVAVAVAGPSMTASAWLLVAYGLSTTALAARHMLGAGRVLRMRYRWGGWIGPLIPSRRRALAQLRRELARLPETRRTTGR
jgi:hypothetical protein